MSDSYNIRAQEILRTIKYATLATVTPDGKPWNSPVGHNIDDDYTIYWFSDKESQHSINIRHNPHVYIVIYDSTAPDGEGEGVYIEALAHELSDDTEIGYALNLNPASSEQASDFLGDSVRRCYQAVPKRLWMNDAEIKDDVFIRDYRVELRLLKKSAE